MSIFHLSFFVFIAVLMLNNRY